jgi:hypothetical protein
VWDPNGTPKMRECSMSLIKAAGWHLKEVPVSKAGAAGQGHKGKVHAEGQQPLSS